MKNILLLLLYPKHVIKPLRYNLGCYNIHPPRMNAPSYMVPSTEQMVIKPYLVPLLPNFHGRESENPYLHMREFE